MEGIFVRQKKTRGKTAQIGQRLGCFRYRLVAQGIVVGAAAGLVAVLFRYILQQAGVLLQEAVDFGARHPWFIPVWFAVLLAAAKLVALLLRWEPLISGSGIPQVEGELEGELEQKWWRVLLAKLAGGLLCIGAGLSLGREGPSIQLGAMAGKGFARLTGKFTLREKEEERLLITCGAGAGLAAAFNAPLAGVLFVLEELHKRFCLEMLLATMASAITADWISRCVFGLAPVFSFPMAQELPLQQYWAVLLLGVVLGLLGVFYNACVSWVQALYDKIPWLFVRLAIPFLLAGALVFLWADVLGSGHQLIGKVGGTAWLVLLALFAVKFVFSMLSFGSGAPGGIFLPLLVLGALAGGLFCQGIQALGGDLAVQNCVILGMAGAFAAIVRSPITGTILIGEMTGWVCPLPAVALVSLTAYLTADLLGAQPIYDQLLCRLLKKRAGN